MIGAVLLRVVGLRFPFEQDELYTVIESRQLFASPLEPGIHARPLYYLLQHALFEVLPPTRLGLRVLPLLFGVLGVWVTWRIGRDVGGSRAGLIAALLAAISPWHLYASGMARYWSLVYLLAALFCTLLQRAHASDQARDWRLALVPLGLGSLTHPSFLFCAAGAAVGAAAVGRDGAFRFPLPGRKAWKNLWLPYLGMLALWAGVLVANGSGSDVRNLAGRGLGATVRLLPAIVQWATTTVVGAGVVAAGLLMSRPRPVAIRRWGAMTAACLASTTLLLFAASLTTDVYADYAIGALPAFYVAIGVLCAAASRLAPGQDWVPIGAVSVVLTAGVVPSTASHLLDGTRFDYRPAFDYVTARAPDAAVLAWPVIIQRAYAPALDADEFLPDPRYLDSTLTARREFWAIVSVRRYGIVNDGDGATARWLVDWCSLIGDWSRPRFDYRVYRVELYRCRGAVAARGP